MTLEATHFLLHADASTGSFAALHLFYLATRNALIKRMMHLDNLAGVRGEVYADFGFVDDQLVGCKASELCLSQEEAHKKMMSLRLNPATRDVFVALHASWLREISTLKARYQQKMRRYDAAFTNMLANSLLPPAGAPRRAAPVPFDATAAGAASPPCSKIHNLRLI